MKTEEFKIRIEDNIDSEKKLKENTAHLIATFVLQNSKSRSASQVSTDVQKLLRGYSAEEIGEILLITIGIVGKNAKSTTSTASKQGGGYGDGGGSASFLKSLT